MNDFDAGIVARVASNLASFDEKKPDLGLYDYPGWAGLLEVNARELLRIIEHLATCQVCGCLPALVYNVNRTLDGYRPACGCADLELAGGYAGKHEAGA